MTDPWPVSDEVEQPEFLVRADEAKLKRENR
jgi:hypothetical protein